jgi:hypothetical protein
MKKETSGRSNGVRPQRKLTPARNGEDRRRLLQAMGAAAVAGGTMDAAFISSAFGAVRAVTEMTRAQIPNMVQSAITASNHPEHFALIETSLASVGLTQRVENSVRAYQAATRDGKSKTVTIIPYHPTDKTSHIVGSVGIGAGSPPSGVSVELDGTKIKTITTHDVLFGKVVTKTLTPADLQSKGPASFVERDLPRSTDVVNDITVDTASDLSQQSFKTFLAEEQAAGLYTAAQVRGFLLNAPTMRLMAQMQYARHRGLTMSHASACCSCCTTCWGCCSCSCAVTSSYLSQKYQSRAAAALRRV